MQKIKKIICIPRLLGMAGLLFLTLKLYVFPSPAAPAQGTTIKFFLPSENRSNRFAGYYTIDRDIQQKKIIHVDLTGDTAGDAKRTEFIATEARHLKYNGDTSSIIAIHLSDKTSYSQFVELNNIMLRDGHKRYALWKNNFYILFGGTTEPATHQPMQLIEL